MDGSTDAVNGGVANEVPRASIKGGIVGLAERRAGERHRRSTANLALEETKEVVDAKPDINRNQGGF